jgi:hypothetical protein
VAPAGHTFPGRRQLNLNVSEGCVERLREVCEHEAALEAARSGRAINPRQIQSRTVEMLIYRAWKALKDNPKVPC